MASRGLGTLTLDLIAKIGGFTGPLSKAERELSQSAKRMNKMAKDLGVAIGTGLVTAATAATAALTSSINKMDDLSKAAQRAQMPTEAFSRLTYAGELADVSMENLTKSMGKLAKAQGDAARGMTEQVAGFKQLGVEFKDLETGALRPTYDVFLDFADAFQKHKGSPEIMALGMQVFGRSFQNLIPLLKDGRAGLEAAADEADRFGYTISTQAGNQAEQFNDNLTRLKTIVQGVSNEVASNLLPDLVALSDGFINSTTEGNRLKETAQGLTDFLRGLGTVAHIVSSAFEIVGTGIATVVAQAEAAVRFLMGDFRNAISLYKEASAGFNAEIDEAFGRNKSRANVPQVVFAGEGAAPAGLFRNPAPSSDPITISAPKRALSGGRAKRASGGLSEEAKAAQELTRSYTSLNESMAERIALFGEVTELQKVSYDIENGTLKGLDGARADVLRKQAEELDAKREAVELDEEAKRLIEGLLQPYQRVNAERERAAELLKQGAISQEQYNASIAAHSTPAEQMLADMKFDLELLGKTREQQDLLTAARYLGAEATTEAGKAALTAMADYQQLGREMSDQISLMDEFRGGMSDALTDFVTGAKSAKEAFADFFNDMAAKITRMIAERWIEQAFGQQGSSGGGTQGGNWIGAIFGALFGGGKASGGWAAANTMYEVNERGFEMASVGGRDYLLTGSNPVHITPNHALSGGGMNQVNQFHFAAPTDPRTQIQVAARVGFETRRAQRRN